MIIQEEVNKKIKLILKDKETIFNLLSLFPDIFKDSPNINTINQAYDFIKLIDKNLSNISDAKSLYKLNSIKDVVIFYNEISKINKFFMIIKNTFNKIFANEQQVFLTQTYLDKFINLQKNIQIILTKSNNEIEIIDARIDNICLDALLKYFNDFESEGKIPGDFIQDLINLCKDYQYSWKLYKMFIAKIIDKYENTKEMYDILQKNEQAKNYIFLGENVTKNDIKENKEKFDFNNPPLYNYGLIPVLKPENIKYISSKVFEYSVENIKEFEDICKKEKYDLVIIKKILDRGISYNILDLMNFEKSKEYEKTNSSSDGINTFTIERYRNISYIADINKKKKWEISYKYIVNDQDHKFVIILEELYPNTYQVLSNNFDSFFVRKTAIIEFFKSEYLSKHDSYSRIHGYNRIINNDIMNNMFLPLSVDTEVLLKKSQIVDAKYLRHEIYSKILSEFIDNYDKSNPKNIYDISKLVHDEKILKLFNQIMMDQFHSHINDNMNLYESKGVSLAEIYTSFIYTMNTYDRDFVKKIHDEFSLEIVKLKNLENIDKNIDKKEIIDMFDKILKTSVNAVITLQSNIFQILHYKLYLLNIPFSNSTTS